MTRALITVNGRADRERAIKWVQQAPVRTRIEFKASKRSLPQNDRMWAMLTDIATQVVWHGKKLTPDDWKLVFLDGLKRELRLVPNLNSDGFVNLGRSSSDLTKTEMSDLFALIEAFGAEHEVAFHDPDSSEPTPQTSPSGAQSKPVTENQPPAQGHGHQFKSPRAEHAGGEEARASVLSAGAGPASTLEAV